MNKFRAHQYLSRFSQYETIGSLYDEDDMLSEAILTLMPDFEYPDWSHKSVPEFLRKAWP